MSTLQLGTAPGDSNFLVCMHIPSGCVVTWSCKGHHDMSRGWSWWRDVHAPSVQRCVPVSLMIPDSQDGTARLASSTLLHLLGSWSSAQLIVTCKWQLETFYSKLHELKFFPLHSFTPVHVSGL